MYRSLFGLMCLLIVIVTSGTLCSNSGKVPDPITLQYWTVFTDQEDINSVIDAFKTTYPYISIEVRQLVLEEYEHKLIEAWAQGEGPDIFSVPNSHLGAFKDLIEPLPTNLTITTVTQQEKLGKKETIYAPATMRSTSIQELSSTFPQVVYDDVVLSHQAKKNESAEEKIFGLPQSLDTMILYYNKDLLNRAKIPLPAETWEEFVTQVPNLTLVDVDNNIIQAGAALGTADNIPRMFDIMSLLMMQNGAVMTVGERVNFALESETQADYFPGVRAVEFYTSFADSEVEWYSWNANQPDAFESFVAGKVAYFLGYHYHLAELENRAPNLNFDIAPVPQVDLTTDISYANYWVETVSVNSAQVDEAWAFVEALTTDPTNVAAVLEKTERPAALKALLADQQEDYVLSIFANQTLTAQSWYAGVQPEEVEQQFAEMVTIINEGRLDVTTAVTNTADKVELTYKAL